jgi:hypothetical protein
MTPGTQPLAAFIRTLLFWTLAPAVVLVTFLYLLLAMVGLAPMPDDCITEVRGRISGVSGFDFESSETDCDTITKTATMSVFASKRGRPKKVLLFKFGPAYADLLPTVSPVDQNRVQISIREISDLIFRRNKPGDLSIDYKIDIVDYPSDEVNKNE